MDSDIAVGVLARGVGQNRLRLSHVHLSGIALILPFDVRTRSTLPIFPILKAFIEPALGRSFSEHTLCSSYFADPANLGLSSASIDTSCTGGIHISASVSLGIY